MFTIKWARLCDCHIQLLQHPLATWPSEHPATTASQTGNIIYTMEIWATCLRIVQIFNWVHLKQFKQLRVQLDLSQRIWLELLAGATLRMKQRSRRWFFRSKLFCGCETGLAVRHPAAYRTRNCDRWLGERWNCWEVIFTRLKTP